VPELIAYQDEAYARTYAAFVQKTLAAVLNLGTAVTPLSEAVARYLFKLMAYKDEYEVARLYLRPEFRQTLAEQFGADAQVTYQLHPPFLRSLGVRRKMGFGRWFDLGYKLLTSLKRLRGTPFDLFGYAHVRRVERTLIGEYRGMIERELADLSPDTLAHALEVAQLPDMIRGYEQIKLDNVTRFRQKYETAVVPTP
jgi:indolepyruvate ferredoxin oxidoreductase